MYLMKTQEQVSRYLTEVLRKGQCSQRCAMRIDRVVDVVGECLEKS